MLFYIIRKMSKFWELVKYLLTRCKCLYDFRWRVMWCGNDDNYMPIFIWIIDDGKWIELHPKSRSNIRVSVKISKLLVFECVWIWKIFELNNKNSINDKFQTKKETINSCKHTEPYRSVNEKVKPLKFHKH